MLKLNLQQVRGSYIRIPWSFNLKAILAIYSIKFETL